MNRGKSNRVGHIGLGNKKLQISRVLLLTWKQTEVISKSIVNRRFQNTLTEEFSTCIIQVLFRKFTV